jgi:hypothetical protein
VRADSTLICLHSGSFEYIGVRHRATQRLYLSDMITTHSCQNPGYGKLQVGVYIASLNDAIDRALQLSDKDESHDNAPERRVGDAPSNPDLEDDDDEEEDAPPKKRGRGTSRGRKSTRNAKGSLRQRTCHSNIDVCNLSSSYALYSDFNTNADSVRNSYRLSMPSVWDLRFSYPSLVYTKNSFPSFRCDTTLFTSGAIPN